MKSNIILFMGLFCAFSSTAQEALSLSDAIRIGLERNYDIQIERKNIEISENNNSFGEAGRWPTITLNLNANNNLTDNVKTAFPTATQGQTLANTVNPTANVNWTLFNGFSVKINKRRLEQLQAETSGNASIVIANTLQSIILGYYLAVLEQQRLDEFEKQLELSRDKYDYVKIKSEMGSAVSTDLLLEEGNYLTDSLNFINQQLAYRNALRNLNVLLAESADKSFTITDSLTVPLEVYEISALRSKMLGNNVDLEKQYITQAILGYDSDLQRTNKYPNLTMAAGFSENRNSLDLSSASFFTGDPSVGTNGFVNGPNSRLSTTTDNYFVNFTLSYTLFNGGKIKRAIKNALVSENIGELRLDKLKTTLNRDLSQAFDRYGVRQQLYGINDRRELAAKTNLDISQDKFRNGSINSFDYRTVQNTHLSAAILKLQATYNLIESSVELMRLTGGLIEEYNN